MGLKLAGVMMIIMGVVGGIFYWYYTDTQEKMAIMHENNAKLETAMQTQKQAIDQYQKDIKLVTASKLEVEEQLLPNRLCNYLFELSQAFNRFYDQIPILKAEEPSKSSRLILCRLTERTLTKGLNLLGISTLERM